MTWQRVCLGEYIDLISGPAFKSARFTDNPDDIPLVKGDNLAQGYVSWEKSKYWPQEDAEKYSKYWLNEGDVILAMDRPWVTAGLKYSWIKSHDPKAFVVQRVARMRGRSGLLSEYLRYIVGSKHFSDYIKNIMGGTNVPHISPKQIGAYEIALPPERSQLEIVRILSNYDDLIENNKRRITLLEDSVQQIYKEWFVRFRFPGHEHVKIVDGVPAGWLKTTYGEISQTIGGGTPSTNVNEYWDDGDITWFTPKDLTNNNSFVVLDSEKKITKLGLQKSSAKLLPPNTIMMSSRASIGYFGLFDGEAATNQGFISVIPNNEKHRMFILHNLSSRKEEIINLAGGSTYKEINKTTFRNMEIVIPTDSLAEEFETTAWDAISQVRLLMKQNFKLSQARDLLLPKLMSGELAV